MKIGFIINPIAGMGGRVGLKGTDGVLDEAVLRGAEPVAQLRAQEAISRYMELIKNQGTKSTRPTIEINWLTCAGSMGYDALHKSGSSALENTTISIVFEPSSEKTTTAEDTKNACKQFLTEGVKLIVFCGGDGTARDIYSIVENKIPMLGIPSGVKMHSGVFGTHAKSIGDLIVDFLKDELDIADGEILDLDETKYRAGEWNIQLFGVAKTPHDPTLIQRGKHMIESVSENELKEEIAEFIEEEMSAQPEIIYILGPGSTVQAIGNYLGLEVTLLGIDVVFNKKLIGTDLNEKELLQLLDRYTKAKLILSPIGAQGFILGRGNLQLSPEVIKKIGIENIEVISTPAKLGDIEALRVDTNDRDLDNTFIEKGWLTVIIGYRQMKMKKITI